MTSAQPVLERNAAPETVRAARGRAAWIAPAGDAVPDTTDRDTTDSDTADGDAGEEAIAAGPAEGPFAEGAWRALRWWVLQLTVVFDLPERLALRWIARREVSLLAIWLRGIEGLARRLLVATAAGIVVERPPESRPGKAGVRTARLAADKPRRRCFRALDWRAFDRRPAVRGEPAPRRPAATGPRRVGKRLSRYHPAYNPVDRGAFDPPPRRPCPRRSRAGRSRPGRIADNPWRIFPPDAPSLDDGGRWPALPYARRIEALRWLVYRPEQAARRLALRIARHRDGWEKLALIRDPARGKTEPPAWRDWFRAHLDAREACLARWKQAYAAAHPPDTG